MREEGSILKRLIIICKEQYEGYVSNIQSTYETVEAYGFEIDEALVSIPGINPGAVVFLNYYSPEDYQSGLALEHLAKVRSLANHQILVLSSTKPPVEFIMQASEYGAKTLWGKEIDFDIDSIPETDPPERDQEDDEQKDQVSEQSSELESENIDNEPEEIEESEEDPVNVEEENENGGLIKEKDPPADKINKSREIIVCLNEFKESMPDNWTFVDRFEDIPEHISETTKAVIITSNMLAGSFSKVKNIIKRIPKETVKLYAIDNYKLNQLIYGEIGLKEGIKFYRTDQINQIFEDIQNNSEDSAATDKKPEVVEDIQDEKPEKKKFKFNLGAISEKLSTVVEVTKNIKPEIKIPKLQFRDTSQAAPTKKVEFVERNKVLLIMSPISTGKTEIASNLAAALAEDGFKTALVDLDTSKKGCFYNFPLFEKDDIFILRKICVHLDNGGLEDDIESYAYKSGKLHVYTAHRDVDASFGKSTLISFIRHLKGSFDVVVVDVGKDLPKDIIESLMDVDGIRKFMVATQNIEHLNTIPYCYKWFSEFPLYYKDWMLIVNRYTSNSGISDSDIGLYFEDPDQGHELSFKLNKTYNIPEAIELIGCKSKRSTVYGKDKEFSEGVKKLVEDWKKGEI